MPSLFVAMAYPGCVWAIYCRAMHYRAKRGLAIACRLSVCDVGGS